MVSPVIALANGATFTKFPIETGSFDRVWELANTFSSDGQAVGTPFELHAHFLQHCISNDHESGLVVLNSFCHSYGVPSTDIHVVVQKHGLDEDAAQRVLRAYYLLWSIPAAQCCYFVAKSHTRPALFGSEQVCLTAMFGGQPSSSSYLNEARWLLDIYSPILHDYVKHMSMFLDQQSEDTRLSMVVDEGLDIYQWLTEPDSSPDDEYLVSAPVSMPLAGLVQLMQVMVLYKTLGMTPSQFAQHFKVAVGHSQGIVTATMLSMLSDNESFEALSKKALGLLLLIGAVPQKDFPNSTLANDSIGDTADSRERPMVQVRGISMGALEEYLTEFNKGQLSYSKPVYLAVANTHDQFIVAGAVTLTRRLVQFLRSQSASPDEDQSKVPFAKRKPVIAVNYVDITVPYHCRLLQDCVGAQCAMAQEKSWCLDAGDMQLPVRAADDGHDIRTEKNLTRYLFESICVLPVNWPTAISAPDVTHIVDFGTGGFSGFGQLARRNVEGRGIPVICAGALVPRSSHEPVGTKGDLYQRQLSEIVSAPNWLAQFGPRLVRTAHDGHVHIDTRMQRILGAPTVMVAGMTPTTANLSFVAAINNAGYHAELAGGGMHTEADMERMIKELAKSVAPGQGITLNCIYINPRQWSFQLSTLLRLRSEGLPIAGLCIGGGVPSFDAALEVIDSLRSADIRHVAFKPSTAEAIRHVVKVAQACDGFPIVLQWTGGRAGGHHSYEDFHQSILETYAAIRTCDNIALVAGSGFGDAAGTLPYLTGDWSIAYGRAPMPFDGVLLGSRVMVAKEATTSLAAKELIVAAQGLSNSDWHKTYDGAYNGVTTITTEYGELNHMLATRGAMFARDMHRTILSQPRDQREVLLRARKGEVIARLNRDYMRPWFGKKRDGRVVDLEDMMYTEVVDRLVELMYVKLQQRWIHPSYFRFAFDFIGRIERRMRVDVPQLGFIAHLHDTDPLEFGSRIAEEYPEAATQQLASEDVQFFVSLCKRRGQKPVPFIPVLDMDFGTLLQKDTTGQSEDLDAVVDQDPQRTFIQQGAVAARYSTVANEPVKKIMDGIYHSHIASLVQRLYGGNESRIPVVEYIGDQPSTVALPALVRSWESASERVFQLPRKLKQLPELSLWLQALAGPWKSWLRVLLTTPAIAQGSRCTDNYVGRMLRPRAGRAYHIFMADGVPVSLAVMDSAGATELDVTYDAYGTIRLSVYHAPSPDEVAILPLSFQYRPSQTLASIHASSPQEDQAVQKFYRDTWAANSGEPYVDVTSPDEILTSELTISKEHSRAFCTAVRNITEEYLYPEGDVLFAPVEFTHILITDAFLRLMQSSLFGPGQASIVHLYNRLVLEENAPLLCVGDKLRAAVSVDGFVNTDSGKKMTILATVYCNDRKYATVDLGLLSRSYFIDTSRTFRRNRRQRIVVLLPSEVEVAALEAKDWFVYREDSADRLEPGAAVEFCLNSEYGFKSERVYSSVATTGAVVLCGQNGSRTHVADVDFRWGTCTGNPVTSYLSRYKVDVEEHSFDNGGYSLVKSGNARLVQVTVPNSNQNYARYSLDNNSIHVNPYVADYANLPGTITHGMWTSASTRAVLERVVTGNHPERIRAYRTDFVGMVLPRDELTTELSHVGMKQGRMLVTGQTSKVGGGPVMTFTAEIDQPLTAYLFTGQGSQTAGMGMDLYEQSPAARAIWDRANAHMLNTYDIDLMDIVRNNPAERTIYFDDSDGEQVQNRYMALPGRLGKPVISDITKLSTSYTFRSPTGLLNSTQFTQVALVANAMASVADLRSQGLVQKDALFAGHSLGEYAALAALGQVFSVEDVLDIVFYRGLIMQSAVLRDEHGHSKYSMTAINPSRVSRVLDEETLQAVVDRVRSAGSGLLQVVNYNVSEQQYVVAGTQTNLAALRMVLDGLKQTNVSDTVDIIPAVDHILSAVLSAPIDATPVRGVATIPLDGIDVPFHSEKLADRVDVFRQVLQAKTRCETLAPCELCGRYIPNLTGKTLELTREYFERVHEITNSPVIKTALDVWDDTALSDSSVKARLTWLLLVELLAYQLASPVQWIGTQRHLFENACVQRVVEVGPSPVLCGMADRTLRRSEYVNMSVSVLHAERDMDDVYYRHVNGPTPAAASVPEMPAEKPKEAPEPVQKPMPQGDTGTSVGGLIADVPLPALDVVHAVVAFKLKQQLSAVSAQQDIKTLTGGKSTLQNEIVADLQKEFGDSIPDKPEEMSLQELGSTIGTAGSLGKCTQPLVTRMFSGKMPGGFSLLYARDTLETAYGLGPQRQDALLLVALTMEPASRLGSDAEATAWLDKAAQTYATRAGISYAQTAGAAAGAQASGPVVSSAEMKKMQQQQYEHAQQQIEVLARYSGVDLRKDGHTAEAHQAAVNSLQNELDAVSAEFGDKLLSGVRPQFDVRKARHFDSYWNWARQDAYQWIQQAMTDAMAGKDTALDEDRVHRLVVRTDQGLIQLLKGAAKILATDTNPALEPARQFVRHLYGKCVQALDTSPIYKEMSCPTQPLASVSVDGSVSYSEVPRKSEPTFVEYIEHMGQEDADAPPFIHICEQQHSHLWNHNRVRTESYFGGLSELCSQGLSFVGKTALVTGCGRGSIGADIIRGLLMGGAKVLATTSSYSRKTTLFFEDIYRQYGARGSELTVVPFNQGSVQDIDALVRYIFDRPTSGHPALGWRLNYVFPFAAISDIGSTVSDLESHSELAQRVGLTNVMRLLGHIKAAKEKASYIHRPALVVMPLSPNHGNLGGDGLYGECKAALETVFNRWDAESWEGHLSIVGASIGWTRGTGLMNSTNSIAPRFEELGIRTFSTREMAFNILGLLHPRITHAARHMPVLANLGGRMGLFGVMSGHLKEARMSIQTRSDMYQLASKDQSLDFLLEQPGIASLIAAETDKTPLAKPRHNFPETKSYDGLEHLHHLQDMVNLDKVVVITGYGEFGAHGNAETRWEMEAFGQLSIEGCIELAWIMGLIRHHNGQLAATGQHYVGWVDAKSGDAVRDADIKAWYEEYILAHTGIRLIEPELVGGYDPNRKQVMREIQIQHDMEPFKASSDDAAAYKKSNGDRVDTWENEDGSSWSVRFLKGALIRVPAAASTASLVAGQLPTGWNAKRFGIPEDIIDQVDPITLYTLVAVVEALVNSGITDPYELYQYFHVSEVGSSIGSTLGGGQSTYDMLWRRGNDEDIGGAKLQEAFISTVQAWVNMLLMSGSGPVKPIAGACATALLSVDTAVEAIQQGKAKVVVAGGVEDLAEGSITEFEKMGATANTVNELASGRTPTEMSRPCTTTRSGFVEGQGASAVVLMSASAAMEYGAPIYGVVGMSSTATDKQGRSVPAPGKGVLGSARETASTVPSSLLDFNYRRQRLLRRIRALEMQMQEELEELDNTGSLQELAARKEDIQLAYAAERMGVQDAWGSEFWKRNYRISPLRGSLAVWGLTADDIGLASFHGTSTKANDQNESSVVNKQMEHLGRTPGHVLPVVCQKWITGHPKAGAAGFMLNGALQSLRSGVIPGNRNADNIDMELKGREYLLYLSKTIQTGGIKAALLKSFGFGQVGGELLIVHSDYILATLAREQLEAYRQKVEQRSVKANRYWQDVLVGNRPFVQVKEQAPYTADQEVSILLDPTRRAHRNAATGKYAF